MHVGVFVYGRIGAHPDIIFILAKLRDVLLVCGSVLIVAVPGPFE